MMAHKDMAIVARHEKQRRDEAARALQRRMAGQTMQERALNLPDSDRCRFLDGGTMPGSNFPQFRTSADGEASNMSNEFAARLNRVARKRVLPDYLTTAQASAILDVSATSIHDGIQKGILPGYQVLGKGSEYRLPVAAFLAYIKGIGLPPEKLEYMEEQVQAYITA